MICYNIFGDNMSSLFNKSLPRSCQYCVYGKTLPSKEVLCIKCGVTELRDSCRHYKYDPLKRIPARAEIADNYHPEDFMLE